jgi:hypothetical protein
MRVIAAGFRRQLVAAASCMRAPAMARLRAARCAGVRSGMANARSIARS